jgi:hypothetical protein
MGLSSWWASLSSRSQFAVGVGLAVVVVVIIVIVSLAATGQFDSTTTPNPASPGLSYSPTSNVSPNESPSESPHHSPTVTITGHPEDFCTTVFKQELKGKDGQINFGNTFISGPDDGSFLIMNAGISIEGSLSNQYKLFALNSEDKYEHVQDINPSGDQFSGFEIPAFGACVSKDGKYLFSSSLTVEWDPIGNVVTQTINALSYKCYPDEKKYLEDLKTLEITDSSTSSSSSFKLLMRMTPDPDNSDAFYGVLLDNEFMDPGENSYNGKILHIQRVNNELKLMNSFEAQTDESFHKSFGVSFAVNTHTLVASYFYTSKGDYGYPRSKVQIWTRETKMGTFTYQYDLNIPSTISFITNTDRGMMNMQLWDSERKLSVFASAQVGEHKSAGVVLTFERNNLNDEFKFLYFVKNPTNFTNLNFGANFQIYNDAYLFASGKSTDEVLNIWVFNLKDNMIDLPNSELSISFDANDLKDSNPMISFGFYISKIHDLLENTKIVFCINQTNSHQPRMAPLLMQYELQCD